jgi:uncharacterized integral membrane protein (TIGR00698 family)
VVVAGKSVSEHAASAAVIEKMLRVMMLAPFLVILSSRLNNEDSAAGKGNGIVIPWFAVLFIVASGVNSLQVLPAVVVESIVRVDTVLLAMAMGALGLRTHIGAIRQAGLKPILLACVLFAFLMGGGYVINQAVTAML